MTDAQKADLLLAEDEPVRQAAPPAPPLSSAASMRASPDMIAVYVQDAEDLIENAEQALLKIGKSPNDAKELIREVLRALHTLKGNSGLMGMNDIEQLGHKLETLWQLVSEGILPDAMDIIIKLSLNIVDLFRKTVASISQGGNGKILAFAGFSDLLDEMIPAGRRAESKPPPPGALSPAPVAPANSAPKPVPEKTEEKARVRGESETGSASPISRSIRVNIDKLDQLNNLVGELVIAEAMVTHNTDLQGLRLDSFDRSAHQLRLITTEIQDVSMALADDPRSTPR